MSRLAENSLYRLIHSLVRQEKRYFKVFASLHTIGKVNHYIYLFDVIEGQKQYDEGAIREALRRRGVFPQIHVAKNYLYRMVLRSLEQYHAASSAETLLRRRLHQVEILYNKSLYADCHKLISASVKLAEQHRKTEILLELLEWEKMMLPMSAQGMHPDSMRDDLYRRGALHLVSLRRSHEFWNLNYRASLLNRNIGGKIRSKRQAEEFRRIILHPLIAGAKEQGLSDIEKIHYYNILGIYHFAKDNLRTAYRYTRKRVDIISAMPGEDIGFHLYLSVLGNHIIICYRMGKMKEAFEYLRKLRRLPEAYGKNVSPYHQSRIFMRSVQLETDIHLHRRDYGRIISIAPYYRQGIRRYGGLVSPGDRIVIHYQIAYAFFVTGNYRESLNWVNSILNLGETWIRNDVKDSARILFLILHFEMGSYDLLEYSVKSTYRYLYKKDRLYRFESAILNFIRKVFPHSLQTVEMKQRFRELERELRKTAQDPYEKKALEYFNFIDWVRSKISGMPIAEIVKKQDKKPV